MLTLRPIKPSFEHLDKDLILRWTWTGNKLSLDRSVNTMFGLPRVTADPGYILNDDDPTVAAPAGALIGSPIGFGYQQWEDLKENIVVDPSRSVLSDAARSASLAMIYIDKSDIQARFHTLVRALFEARPQTSVQDEVEEIKDWYADKVSQTLEAEALLYKQYEKNIDFVVVVNHIRRDHSFQLSDIACEIDDLYPHWHFGFQYVSIRTAGQLPLDEYSDLINGG